MSYRKTQLSWKIFSLFYPNWLKVMRCFISAMGLAVEKPWAKMSEASDSNAQSWNLTALPKVCPVAHLFHKMLCKEKLPGSEMFGKYWVNHILVGLFPEEFLVRDHVYCICVLPMGWVLPSHRIYPKPHIIRFFLDSLCCTHHRLPGLLFNIWWTRVLLAHLDCEFLVTGDLNLLVWI